ncbi:DUF6479 family protein [Streptomyces sp. NPDC059378]|uniref:DUF6479 family protein n=1 Tax=Streptomyces sp. NPDC059378 TaxID=3346815 RepID=UPI0036A369D0
MITANAQIAAGSGWLTLGPLLAGLAVVAILLSGFYWGAIVRRRESPPPRPDEQPHLPPGGAVREVQENREPDEMPKSRNRVLPHDLHGYGNLGTRSSASKTRPRWARGTSGSFGGGGLGGH